MKARLRTWRRWSQGGSAARAGPSSLLGPSPARSQARPPCSVHQVNQMSEVSTGSWGQIVFLRPQLSIPQREPPKAGRGPSPGCAAAGLCHVWGHHIGHLKSIMVKVFTPREGANTTSQGFAPREPAVNHLPAHHHRLNASHPALAFPPQ